MTTSNSENIQKKFGSRLRQIRQNMGLSQEELAHLCNLDRSYMGGVERGERNISLVNIHKIADALNISPREFFNDIYS
jgi:transcriptional regulator with XRE-family HTH domain